MMEFYMTPGSCSTGIHILLEELELVFSAHVLNLPKGDHLKAEYRKLNPKGTIPTLVLESGDCLTDFTSIAWWLGSRYPKAKLLPQNPVDQARAIEIINYVTGTVHGQGFTRYFTTEKYLLREDDGEMIKQKGREIVDEGFAIMASFFAGRKGYLFDHFTIADVALFYVEFWAIRLGWSLPKACHEHYELMCSRQVVQRVLYEEGYRVFETQEMLGE